jgi:shikimate dehydrogenase
VTPAVTSARPAPHAAVLGRPVEHSLSPVLHRAAYAALGLDWTYDAIDCGVDELPAVLAARADWAGFSCTMPLKHAILGAATRRSALAEAVGAANTLVPDPAGWRADNTDVHGLVAALRPHVDSPGHSPIRATVLGGGGTAQAAVAALAELGCTSCTVLMRDPARAAPVLATAARFGIGAVVGRLDVARDELGGQVVISTLPPGAADALAARPWSSGQIVVDVAYAGWPTPLAAAAHQAGATTISGAVMLLHQAAAQVELMTGGDAPVAAMRVALLAVAPGCGA